MGLCGNCTAWQNGTEQMYQADPDIAGIGIIIVYIGSAFITLCLSAAHFILTNSDSPDTNPFDRSVYRAAKWIGLFKISNKKRDFWVPVIKKVVLSLSDQQLLTGLAVLIAGFWTHCSISVYHFALVNDLAWFSSTVHLITLSMLQDYFLPRPVLRNWRVALMVAMALLLVTSTVMQGHYDWYDSWPYDAQCLFENLVGNIGGSPRYWMSVSLALISIIYPLSIIPLFERPTKFLYLWLETKPRAARDQAIENLREKMSRFTSPSSFKGSMKRLGCTVFITLIKTISWMYFSLMALISSRTCNLAVDIFWFAYSLWSIIGDRAIPPSEMNGNENAMSFGQIVPILLLSSIVLVFREAYDDQKKKIEEEGHSHSHSSQLSLVRTRSSTAATQTASQAFEMTGAVQDAEDDVEPEVNRPRRIDTEMGGRSQASGLEGEILTQRRPTSSLPADNAQLGSEQSGQT